MALLMMPPGSERKGSGPRAKLVADSVVFLCVPLI